MHRRGQLAYVVFGSRLVHFLLAQLQVGVSIRLRYLLLRHCLALLPLVEVGELRCADDGVQLLQVVLQALVLGLQFDVLLLNFRYLLD